MPVPTRYAGLIARLSSLSQSDRLDWQEGATRYVFVLQLPHGAIDIIDSDEQEDGIQYTVNLYNEAGDRIDTFVTQPHEGYFSVIHDLFLGARRKALGVEESLRRLEADLENL